VGLSQAKKKDLKSVTGYTRGATEKRTIRASYIVEAPVWKTTYRLLFNTKSTHLHPTPRYHPTRCTNRFTTNQTKKQRR
jgi:hypothetical protein